MAWNTINYSCGHTENVQLYGKITDRKAKVASAELGICPHCHAKKAVEQDSKKGFALLTGSPKQIAWASKIRKELLPDTEAKLAEIVEKTPEEKKEEISKKAEEVREYIRNQTSASWWIDHRSGTPVGMIKMVLAATS